jgi:F0F1-type ATP synthase membrane subunit b/b'
MNSHIIIIFVIFLLFVSNYGLPSLLNKRSLNRNDVIQDNSDDKDQSGNE